ncbi:hypothetical protein [Kordia jejudonensis]|uniref:hypothetical protein n=1 Tax=Kordia jejudonensis TaxID=1348245 RepID=UPI000628FB7A|nr:hypothetical protein [Kordia jejudonensis]
METQIHYIKWLSPEEMHEDSLNWLSELNFIKDEHFFFGNLLQTFSVPLSELDVFSNEKEIIDVLNRSQRRTNTLIEAVTTHERELKIMVDGINQPVDEKKYKDTHRDLKVETLAFLENYRMLKTQIFDIIKEIKKEEKFRTLFDKNH